jgi:hypothetical protein
MEVFYSNGGLINYSQFQKLAGTKTGSWNETSKQLTISINGNNQFYGTGVYAYNWVNPTTPIAITWTSTVYGNDTTLYTIDQTYNDGITAPKTLTDLTWLEVIAALQTTADQPERINFGISGGTACTPGAATQSSIFEGEGTYAFYGPNVGTGATWYFRGSVKVYLYQGNFHAYSEPIRNLGVRITGNAKVYNCGASILNGRYSNVMQCDGNGQYVQYSGTLGISAGGVSSGNTPLTISSPATAWFKGGTFVSSQGQATTSSVSGNGQVYIDSTCSINFRYNDSSYPKKCRGLNFATNVIFTNRRTNNSHIWTGCTSAVGATWAGNAWYSCFFRQDDWQKGFFDISSSDVNDLTLIDLTGLTNSDIYPTISGVTATSSNTYQMNVTRPTDNSTGTIYYYIRNILGEATCNPTTGVINVTQSGKFLLCCFVGNNGNVCGQGTVINWIS